MMCSSEPVLPAMSIAVRAAKVASSEPSVASRILVGKMLILKPALAYSVRLQAEVYIEVLVDLHASALGVAIDLQEVGACFGQLGVELVVPAAVERVGHIQPLAVEA